MLDRITKSVNAAMIPSGIVMLLMGVVVIIIGFVLIISTHIVAFESMFPETAQYTIINQHYGTSTVMDCTPNITLYPLFLCLFIDISILLGICKFFKLNIDVALVVFVIVFFAPISIPCILLTYWLQSKGESIRKISLNTWKIILIVLTILVVLVCGAYLIINPADREMMFVLPIIVISSIILIIHLSQRAKTKSSGTTSTSSKSYSAPKYSKSNHSDLADKF